MSEDRFSRFVFSSRILWGISPIIKKEPHQDCQFDSRHLSRALLEQYAPTVRRAVKITDWPDELHDRDLGICDQDTDEVVADVNFTAGPDDRALLTLPAEYTLFLRSLDVVRGNLLGPTLGAFLTIVLNTASTVAAFSNLCRRRPEPGDSLEEMLTRHWMWGRQFRYNEDILPSSRTLQQPFHIG